ncbi:unnamed protein product [Zymoseptoria tritici ST99CH_1E4]|uniref:Uncharacterized protein n=1 Tax=Zymoseptoria tritici ST99CH_1E4 TaxID=1276532 RepID=A0A2H1GXN1_ZYMTR|nr:unnamed protein product [Zymoseptoria tritici ST99CH_1E4]
MPSLLDLPDELLSPILALVSTAPSDKNPTEVLIASYGTYHATALTCKRLHFITRPLLYERITFADGNVPDSFCISSHRHVRLLARTLCETPHLRPLILSLSLHRCLVPPYDPARNAVGDVAKLRSLLKQVVEWGMEDDRVIEVGKWTCQAVWTAVLILLAPRVKHLSVDRDELETGLRYGPHWKPNCLDEVIGMLQETLDAERLTTPLGKFGMDDIRSCALDNVSPVVLGGFMIRPAMRDVRASFLHPRARSWLRALKNLPAGSNDVTSISLTDAAIRPEWMHRVIASCRRLRNLRYEIVSADFISGPPVMHPGLLAEVLNTQRTSLKTLRIINSTDRGDAFTARTGTLFRSLATYHALIHLEVDIQAITGQSVLGGHDLMSFMPLKLKTLKIQTLDLAEKLPDMIAQLSPMQDQFLDELTISCPLAIPGPIDPSPPSAHNADCLIALNKLGPTKYRGQDVYIEHCRGKPIRNREDRCRGRMEVQCRNLQRPGCARLDDVAARLRGDGIMRMIRSQVPQMWEEEVVLGEALMSMFDGVESGSEATGGGR